MTFPTDLRTIAPAGGLAHVYAEFRGMRFYLGSGINMHDAASIRKQWANAFKIGPTFYIRDRSDSTRIDGGPSEFAAIAHHAGY